MAVGKIIRKTGKWDAKQAKKRAERIAMFVKTEWAS
jgi:hypothetical protein